MRRIVLALALVLVLGACGTDAPEADAPATPAVPGDKPEIQIPEGDPPTELVIEDLTEGEGTEATADSTVTVHYVGVSWSTGEEFDSSWDRGLEATFPLTGVIQGWQEGIPGMREGGRRQLIVPPDMGYGANPPPGSGIAPNETLVFVVDLIEVE